MTISSSEDPWDDDLIICTKNRPRELGRCIAAVAGQSHVPSNIVVVDSSDPSCSREVEEVIRGASVPGRRVELITTEPGLPRQRNVGLRVTDGPIVHFIDDDVVTEPAYFSAILGVFRADPGEEIGGVGGLITNAEKTRTSRLLTFLQLDSPRQGAVLPSGKGINVIQTETEMEVDWLSGASMSFRRKALEGKLFDENLGGWAIGEDLDLTYRVKQDWRLVVTPAARTSHLQSPVGRWKLRRIVEVELIHRYDRVRTGIGSQKVACFWLSVCGQLFILSPYVMVKHGLTDGVSYLTGTLSGIRKLVGRKRS